MKNGPNRCPQCGAVLPANAPAGLCPRCVLAMNLATETDVAGEKTGAGSRKSEPVPTPEELAAKFPQLDVLELLGCGGMGAVYKARQKELGRVVALKILPPGIGDDPAFAERFSREARALAKLNHPNIVTLYEFGRADGLFFFLMEFVDGLNLRQLLESGRVASREALAIVPQICDALQYAHDQGIVHRDIKPENILIDRRGRVKVADFGLAKLIGAEPAFGGVSSTGGEEPGEGSPLTEAGRVVGTPDYMAPEQRERPLAVDHRADIYGLGVVFYQMLTGELPKTRLEPPSRKVQIDVRLDEVVLRALEKEPEKRYQQASEVKTGIETIAREEPDAVLVSEEKRQTLRGQLRIPAIGLVVAGLADLVPAAAIFSRSFTSEGVVWAVVPMMAWLVAAAVIFGGAYAMLRLTSHVWAVGAAIVAMMVPPGFLVGIPFGIWALVVLLRKEARRLFASSAKAGSAVRKPSETWARRGIWAGVLGLLAVGAVAATYPTWNGAPPNEIAHESASAEGGPAVERRVAEKGEDRAASYGLGTIELVALAPHPAGEGQAWLPNGAPANEPFPKRRGMSHVEGREMKEIAFRIESNAGNPSIPVTEYGPGLTVIGQGGTFFPPDAIAPGRYFVQVLACIPGAKETDVRIGVADGPWQEVRTLPFGPENRSGQSEESGEDGAWVVGFQGTAAESGEMTLSLWYSERKDFETRVVAVHRDGTVKPLRGSRNDVAAGLVQSLVLFSPEEIDGIEQIQLQRREYRWVSFRKVSLALGHRTVVEPEGAVAGYRSGTDSTEPATTVKELDRMSMTEIVAAIDERVRRVERGMEAGLLVDMDEPLDQINEYCDQLQGKNKNPLPAPEDWGISTTTHLEVLRLLAAMENDAEGMRSIARNVNESESERVALMKRVWKEFRQKYAHFQSLLLQEQAAVVREAQAALQAFVRMDPKDRTNDAIPESLWGLALRGLQPVRVVNERANIRIVLDASEGIESGLYVRSVISSFAPDVDEFLEFTPVGKAEEKTLGQLYRYKRALSGDGPSDATEPPGKENEAGASVAPQKTSWWRRAEVTVTQHGPDHLTYRGSTEQFNDACRTVLKRLSYQKDLGENRTRYPHYGEGGSSDSQMGHPVAERVYLKTKDEHGAEYKVTTIFLDGQDPVVMLENTSNDRYRLINALLSEFQNRGFKVVSVTK